jgi:dipeptidyl aminopeptidase/acylaminoacyl peptidase
MPSKAHPHSWFLFSLSLIISFSCLPASIVTAQSKRPITHEDVWLMNRVGAPVPSPDGRWVVFSVTEPAYDEKDQVADLWIVPADGSAKPRRLTNTKGGESGATWTPDSQQIAFSARREGDEVAQVYLLNVMQGGEAVRLTSLSTGARAPQISPDGKHLLFTSSVFPGAMNDDANKKIAAERKARKYNARVYETFPIRNWDKWMDDKQSHLFVQSLEGEAKAKDLLAGTSLVRQSGFAGATTPGGDELQATWAPDSASIIFVAMTNRQTAAYAETNTNLYQVTVSGGEPVQLTKDDGSYASPKFSPDGKALYSLFEPKTDKIYNLNKLVRWSWPSAGEMKIITAKLDRSPSGFAIAQHNQAVYLTAEEAGRETLYKADLKTDSLTKELEVPEGCLTNIAIPAKSSVNQLILNYESATRPMRVVTLNGTKLQDITQFADDRISKLDIQPLREFTFTSKRGRQIHNFIALPPNFDENKKYPLFVVIHGGPHSMWRDQFVLRWNYHLLAAPGYIVLLTNYTGSTGFGEKFAQNIQLDPLAGPGEEINEAADEAIKRFKFIDASRQAAGGASYGGHLANWLQATTTRYKCLISHAGLVNLESQWGTSDTIYSRELNNGGPVWEQGEVWRKQNPIRYAANFKTPMLITVGENDFRVPLNNSLENWSVHQRLKVPSKLIVFPEENHWVLKGENSRFFYSEVHVWLRKWLDNGTQN